MMKKKMIMYLFIGLGLMGLFLLEPDAIYAAGSGVTELDNAATKTNTLVNWICSWIGGLMALFGIIWAAINQAPHNSEGRNQGIIVGAIVNRRERENNREFQKKAHSAHVVWTEEKYERLRQGVLDGKSYEQIGEELGRSAKAVEHAKRRYCPELVTDRMKRHNPYTGEAVEDAGN